MNDTFGYNNASGFSASYKKQNPLLVTVGGANNVRSSLRRSDDLMSSISDSNPLSQDNSLQHWRIYAAQFPVYRLTDGGKGYIYILRCEYDYFKIGATLNPINRFDRLQRKYKFTWNVECILPCSTVWQTESDLHSLFRPVRVKHWKDWFYLTSLNCEYIKAVVR